MGKPTGLAKAQRRPLGRLKAAGSLASFSLAGGSALAYRLGHPRSNDLGLFSGRRGVDLAALRRELEETLPDVEVVAPSDATLKITPSATGATDGRATGIPIAGPVDIAALRDRPLRIHAAGSRYRLPGAFQGERATPITSSGR